MFTCKYLYIIILFANNVTTERSEKINEIDIRHLMSYGIYS